MITDDVFADDLATSPLPAAPTTSFSDRKFSDELLAKKIKGRQRTFFVDLKQSSNGKFVKISELSRGGQRSTIMFDAEDLDQFLEVFQEIKAMI